MFNQDQTGKRLVVFFHSDVSHVWMRFVVEVIHEKLALPSCLLLQMKSAQKATNTCMHSHKHAPDTHTLTVDTQACKIFLQAVKGEDTNKGEHFCESYQRLREGRVGLH